MSRFEDCLSHVLIHEGGYVDHPSDPGGATNMGITRKTLARWRGIAAWHQLPKSEVRALGTDEAAKIYRAQYWDRCRSSMFGMGLDLAVFDYAVNSGPARAIKALQTIVGAVPDGYVGPVTLGAYRTARDQNGMEWLITKLCQRRLSFLQRLKNFATFGRGWTRRIENILTISLADAGLGQPSSTEKRTNQMNILSGYKTYIVAAAMLIAGVAQLLGVDISGFDSSSAMHLISEALAVLFLRRGLATGLSAL